MVAHQIFVDGGVLFSFVIHLKSFQSTIACLNLFITTSSSLLRYLVKKVKYFFNNNHHQT